MIFNKTEARLSAPDRSVSAISQKYSFIAQVLKNNRRRRNHSDGVVFVPEAVPGFSYADLFLFSCLFLIIDYPLSDILLFVCYASSCD